MKQTNMERKEAIESLRQLYSETNAENKVALECLIPELKESEDERIRKFLVKHVSEWIGCIEHDLKISSKDVESEEELAMFKAGLAYLEKQKEQKPNIELIQRAWYMEGYFDGEYKKEPMWIIKTGKGGPKHIKNERYGQPLPDPKPAEWSEADKEEVKDLCYLVVAELGKYVGDDYWKSPWALDSTGVSFPLHFAKLGAEWQKEQKTAEWSEEDIKKIRSEGYKKGFNDATFVCKPKEWSE